MSDCDVCERGLKMPGHFHGLDCPKRSRKPRAKTGPPLGSPAYFKAMPADQAREELRITYDNYRKLEAKYFSLKQALASFKTLLDDVSE